MKTAPFIRRVTGWIVTLVLAYGVFILALGGMQKHLMYFPDPKPFVPSEWALKELQPLPVTTTDGLTLWSWYRAPQGKGKPTVVFFQGNAGHLGYRNYKVRPWLDAGYGVVLVGYRGFSNPGEPSEEGLYRDARAAIAAVLEKGTPESSLVLYGESLGTGVATQMATEYKAAGLVLESPYTSLSDVGAERYPLVPVRWLLTDHYDSLSKIGNIAMPLLLLHGEDDGVVPTKFGRQLFAAAHEPKQGVFIPHAGHNNIYDHNVQQIVAQFIAALPMGTASKTAPR